jgi:hypothetical protein
VGSLINLTFDDSVFTLNGATVKVSGNLNFDSETGPLLFNAIAAADNGTLIAFEVFDDFIEVIFLIKCIYKLFNCI